MADKKEYVKLWLSYESYFEAFSDVEVGRLVRAMMKYRVSREEPKFNGNERFIWPAIRRDIDESLEAQEALSQARSSAGKQGGRPKAKKANAFDESKKSYGQGQGQGKGQGHKETSPDGDAKKAALAAVMDCYLGKVNPMASPASLDELKSYVAQMGPDCCLRAINIALDEKKTTWSYIKAILQNKLSHGVRCIADWDALDAKREEGKKRGTAQSSDAAPSGDGSFRGWRAKSALDD